MKDRAGQGKESARGREPSRLWSVMYPAHFRMSENPFTTDADPKFLWHGGKRKEILDELVRGILDRAGVHVVFGASGAGKTHLANALVDELGDRALAVVVPCTEYKGIDFLKLVERAFGIGGDPRDGESFVERFLEFLIRASASGKAAVLIVDDAHRLNGSCLRELSEISGIQENGTRLLQIVFFGENRFRDIVNDEVNRGLFESAGVRITLDPLTRDETAQYIRHRLRITHCERELFTSDAVEEIFAFSKGIPGLINRACEAALSRAFYLGEQLVPQDTVREALKLMPPDRTTPGRPSRNLSFEMAAASGPEKEEEADDEDEPGIPAGQVRRRNRSWIAYAVLGGVLIALIVVTSVVLKGRSPTAPPTAEVTKAVVPPPAPSAGKTPPVAAVDAPKPGLAEGQQAIAVPAGQRVPPAEKAGAAPVLKTQIPERPEGQQASVMTAGQIPSRETELRDAKKKPRQAVRSRQAAAKSPRRESAPATGGAPARDEGRDLSADRAGTESRETVPQKTEQVESGEVIDWLLKKRAEQK